MQRILIGIILILSLKVNAQDTIVLITGKTIPVKSVEYHGYSIDYRTPDGLKLKSIDVSRVYSVKYSTGAERVVFRTDSLDAADFTEDEMRRFIIGEQDARALYQNSSVKFISFGIGGGGTFFGFFGLPVPFLFSSAIGGFSPNVEKHLTFKISGDASSVAGLSQSKVVNSIVGSNVNPVFQKNSKLVIDGKSIVFKETSPLDSAVSIINSKFKAHRVHAANQNNKLKLYRSADDKNLSDQIYLEGFEKRARDYKIRSSLLGGLAGYIVSAITFSIIFHK